MKKILLAAVAVLIASFPLVSAGGGIGCFYEHSENMQHADHPPAFWEEVGEGGVDLTNHTSGAMLVCRDSNNRKVIEIPPQSSPIHLYPGGEEEGCCVRDTACGVMVLAGENCGARAADGWGWTTPNTIANRTIRCASGDRRWQEVVPREGAVKVVVTAQVVTCHDRNGRIVAEVQPGNTVVLEAAKCGFTSEGDRYLGGGIAVNAPPHGRCRGVLTDP